MRIKNFINNPTAYFKELKRRSTRFGRSIWDSGNVVICECCSWKGKRFFNNECPKCKSLPRTRLIPFSVAYFNLDKKDMKVLHVAPNKSEFNGVKTKLSNPSQYDRLDIRPIKHVNLVEDLTDLTLADNIYDLVVVWHVFEHIVEDLKAISEVYRVLKPEGRLLMSVPIHPEDNTTTYENESILRKDYQKVHGHSDHCRSCGLDYFKRFETAGFKTSELKVESLSNDKILRYGLSRSHVVWCFTKKHVI